MAVQEGIREVALGVVYRGDEVLVAENDDGEDAEGAYYRPFGASVAFGEHSRESLRREFDERLDLGVDVGERLAVLERAFEYDGDPHHEVAFCYETAIAERWPYELDAFEVRHGGRTQRAVWKQIEAFENGDELYPERLAELL